MIQGTLCRVTAITSLTFALGACQAQVDPDYRGEPLATFHGTLITDQPAATGSVEPVLLWVLHDGTRSMLTASSVSVSGDFPATFTLTVYSPPPAEVLQSVPPGWTSAPSTRHTGWIAAIRSSADKNHITAADIRGVALEAEVAYFTENDEATNAMFGWPNRPGYHLRRKEGGDLNALIACEAGGVCSPPDPSLEGRFMFPIYQEVFSRCVQLVPDAIICGSARTEPACATIDWTQRQIDYETRNCDQYYQQYVPNPADLDMPLTIRLGTTFAEAFMY
jgi:hypothetical protein